MASLRRSKGLSPDGQTAKFLYTIIKQLDLKAIDWNEVASGLDITNGHAARMRYSRFKAQIEGLPTQTKPRAPRPKKDASVTAKGKGKNKPGYEPGKVDDLKGEDDDCDGDVKMEQYCGLGINKEGVSKIKHEDSMAHVRIHSTAMPDTVTVKTEPGLMTESSITGEFAFPNIKIKQEPTTSQSPPSYPLSPASGLAALDLTSYYTPPPTPTGSTLGFSPTPMNTYPHYPTPTTLPPRATVSLAELQLPPIPRPTHQIPLPTFSYPLSPSPMDFDFDFNAPIAMPPWQPQFDLFRPINVGVKRERMEQ